MTEFNIVLISIACQWRIQDFPEVGTPTLAGVAPKYDFATFSQKLHEIERIWTLKGGGGCASKLLLWRSATAYIDLTKRTAYALADLGGARLARTPPFAWHPSF